MAPFQELLSELWGDGVTLDQASQQALAEQSHDRFTVPGLEGVKGAVVGQSAVAQEEVCVWMPLDQVTACGDRDHEAGPSLGSEGSSHVLREGCGGALGEVEEKPPALSEDPAQEAGHGADEMTMRDGREDLVLQPFGPEKLQRRRRELLRDLARCAADALGAYVQGGLGKDLRPGIVVSIATAGNLAQWHPHLHILATDGGFSAEGVFHPLDQWDSAAVNYRALKPNPRLGTNFVALDPLEWLARIADHIPDPGKHPTSSISSPSRRFSTTSASVRPKSNGRHPISATPPSITRDGSSKTWPSSSPRRSRMREGLRNPGRRGRTSLVAPASRPRDHGPRTGGS